MAEVRRARGADVRGILNLVKRVHIKNLAGLEDGFLMIPNASPVLYQFWFNVSPYCYAAVSGSKVIGILVALPGHVLDQRNEFYAHIQEAFAGEKILFVVQVAVSPDFRGQGVGRAIFGRLFEEAGDAIILSSSMTAPYYNGASERFHLAVGFQKMGEMEASDKSRCYLYLRKNDQEERMQEETMKELQKHGIKTEKQTVKRVMNCPFAWGLENRWGRKIVDEKTCGGCEFHDWREGCVYGLADLPTVRTAIFDEESKTSWFVWRFNCYHCRQPVSIMSFYQNMSSGYYGRCHKCGAFHYYIKWSYATCPEKEKWWYAVGEPDPESIGHVNDGDEKREYQARIPNRLEKKLE